MILLLSGVTGLQDNDNFILFSEEVGGFPVPSKDGFVYFIGKSISKVVLNTRTVHKEIEIYDSTGTTKQPFNTGALNTDQSVLVAVRSTTGGPNCNQIITVTTADMKLKQDN